MPDAPSQPSQLTQNFCPSHHPSPPILPQVSSSPDSLCLGQPQPQSKEPVLSPKGVNSERLFYFRPLRNNLLLHLINLNCCFAERKKMERKISCLHFREWGPPGCSRLQAFSLGPWAQAAPCPTSLLRHSLAPIMSAPYYPARFLQKRRRRFPCPLDL